MQTRIITLYFYTGTVTIRWPQPVWPKKPVTTVFQNSPNGHYFCHKKLSKIAQSDHTDCNQNITNHPIWSHWLQPRRDKLVKIKWNKICIFVRNISTRHLASISVRSRKTFILTNLKFSISNCWLLNGLGREHCTSGLQFAWFGFNSFTTYK